MSANERGPFQPKRLQADMQEETRGDPDGMAAIVVVLRDEHGEALAEVAHPVELHITWDAEKIEAFERFVRKLAAAPEMFDTLMAIALGRYTEGEERGMASAAIATVEGDIDAEA